MAQEDTPEPGSGADPSTFWEAHYRAKSPESSGRPSAVLKRFVASRTPDTALELGCGKGDDAVWLAGLGWRVTAVDISETALSYAARNAEAAGKAGQITFERHDLAESFPEGQFDLVTAAFFQSPIDFPRARILRQAAAAVAPDGLLLLASHFSVPPWVSIPVCGNPPANIVLLTAAETLAELNLDADGWQQVYVGMPERTVTGPDEQTATVSDAIVVLARTR